MPEYSFFSKGKHTVAVKKFDKDRASALQEEGYEKQFEEVVAADETSALSRFADIRKQKDIDQHNFIAGAGQMPLIGILTAAATSLVRKSLLKKST